MVCRLVLLGGTMLLSVACIEGMDRPGDAKVISFPDLTVDGGGRRDGESADIRVDTRSPDMRVDWRSPDTRVDWRSPDTRVDTLSPDTRVDTLSPDASVDTLSPDVSVDTLSPDVSVDTLPPDATFDTLSPDTTVDLPLPDTTSDAPWVDAASAAACASVADTYTAMLLTFEGSGTTITDVTGDHDGTLWNYLFASRTTGMATCGNAMDFDPGTNFAYVVVPDSADWVIDTGSVDLWLHSRSTPTVRAGIIARDDGDRGDGEFSITQLCDNTIIARFQVGTSGRSVCSQPISNDEWHHVGVNFGAGGLQLYVDGQLATRTGQIYCGGFPFDCGEHTTQGISARSNPWVIGARSSSSDPGSALPVYNPFDGLMDSVRISTIRRVF